MPPTLPRGPMRAAPMQAPPTRRTDLAPSVAVLALDDERRHSDDVVGGRCDADARLVQRGEDVATHRVLHFTHAAFLHHEAHRELEPVVGDAPEDARLEILDMHEILGLEVTSRLAGELREGAGVAPRDI